MTLKEVEAEALKLSQTERELLVQNLLASLGKDDRPIEEDPLWELGRSPVDLGVTDASVAHDKYLYRLAGE